MKVLETIAEWEEWHAPRRADRRILVPTMGALHRGHTSLFDLADANRSGGDIIATIFVNPTQFGPNEDFSAYPRQLEADLALCEAHGVDAVFAPAKDSMYLPDASITVDEFSLSNGLCGGSRPGHFNGVCTIVAKLFNLIQPAVSVFGEKDYQQLAVIRRMVRDLNFPVEILGAPTVRESDGLALSSRNAYLNESQRNEAPIIFQTLTDVADGISDGRIRTMMDALDTFLASLDSGSGSEVDYFSVVDSSTLEPLESFEQGSPRLLAAVFFGKTRLIDNVGLPSSTV